jgi:hypothetical protein
VAYVTARKDTFIHSGIHTVDVKAHIPNWVPDSILEDLLTKNVFECKEDGSIVLRDEPDEPSQDGTPPHEELLNKVPMLSAEERGNLPLRIEAVKAAIRYLIAVGDPKDFRKDSAPKVPAVGRVVGFDITFAEMLEGYDAILKE